MLIPHLNTIIATVDEIHQRTGYAGGRFALPRFLDNFEGFVVRPIENLPVRLHALMTRQRGVVWIAFNPGSPLTELRLAITREIGHALLHEGHLEKSLGGEATEHLEALQAERFAEELLAPLWALEAAFSPLPTACVEDEALVRGVALAFGVPRSSAWARLSLYDRMRRENLA